MTPHERPSDLEAPQAVRGLSDATFRRIVDQTGAPFVVIDLAGSILFASGLVDRAVGWTPEQLVGRDFADFLPEHELLLAAEALHEIDAGNRSGDGVPLVFAIRQPDGGTRWVEIGAMPFLDDPGLGVIALRVRPWDSQHHLADFLVALLEPPSLDVVLAPLVRSIASSVEAVGVAIHHGFDGASFAGVVTSWEGGAELPLDGAPWASAVGTDSLRWLEDGPIPEGPPGTASCWVIPISAEGTVAPGVITVWARHPGPPLIGHRHALVRAAGWVSLALVRTAEHQRLEHLAGHDALTGVANRTSFGAWLAGALAAGERNIAVAFCDLDGFKPVNDTYGHLAGDVVLVEVAARLRSKLRVGDELARIGGDEFTVLLRNVPDAVVAGQVADRLLLAVDEPFEVPDGEVSVGMSVGVALAGRGVTADDLLSAADAALYACKRSGGNRRAIVG